MTDLNDTIDWQKTHMVRWWRNICYVLYDSEEGVLSSVTHGYSTHHFQNLDKRCLQEGLTIRTAQTSPTTGNPEYMQWVRPESRSDIERRKSIEWTRLPHMRQQPKPRDEHKDNIPELMTVGHPVPDYPAAEPGFTAGQLLNMLVAHPKARPLMPPPDSGAFTPLSDLYNILHQAGLLEPNPDDNYVLTEEGLAYIRDLAARRAYIPGQDDIAP